MAPIFTGPNDVAVGVDVGLVAAVGVGVSVVVGVVTVDVAVLVGVAVAVIVGMVVGVFSSPFPPQAGTAKTSRLRSIKTIQSFLDI